MKQNEESMQLRPQFHVTGGTGWINDPNGLVVFQGKYHAFYQYYPHDIHWGPMHWGHVVSDDLIHWERLPIALYPGDDGDKNGCFSGSAIVWKDRLWLLYTGFTENGGGEGIRQLQCLASSTDGIHFEKHGVVIGEEDLPLIYCPWDFRDPKVWRKDNCFWCAVAARAHSGRGRTLLYRSDDLFSWQFVGDIFGEDSLGAMIECPDYNEELSVFLCGEQFQPNEGKIHLNIHTSRWYTGELDYETGRFAVKNRGIVDYGFDFYAQQTFAGDNVMLGWMNMWDRNVPSEKYGFAGMLTVARRVDVVDGALYQTPVIKGETVRTELVKSILSDQAKIGVLRVKAKNLRGLTLKLRQKGENYALLTLGDGEWVFDRSRAGESIVGAEKNADSLAGIRRMPFSGDKEVELTVVLDEFSIEIFENGKALSATVYPDLDADGIQLTVDADECIYCREEVK
ncbi:MAG: glycoside hydrolase family 32 protein [Clostridia bacterium]|nr:glycoside hydrolase family 32 protein [Clostridia bacterium]